MDEFVLETYKRDEQVFTHGAGAWLFDSDGGKWLDLASGIGVTALGHGHAQLGEALAEQAGALLHVSNLWRHPLTEDVAARLARLSGLAQVFFSNSGAEANEAALKLARKHHHAAGTGRTSFVALHGGFHGRTLGALSVTANPAYRTPFAPLPEATFVEPEDLAALEEALRAGPAALILEPVQGEGGLRVLSDAYLLAARELCSATGTLLIADEVQSGCGRTGSFLACARAGILPDIATLAKPLGAGVPIGATLVAEHLTGVLVPGDHGTTFGGGPLALRAAQVFLEQLEQDLAGQVREQGARLAAGLDALVQRHAAVEARTGRGLMQGLVIPGRATEVKQALHAANVLALTATPDVLRLLPPFVLTTADLDLALERLDEALSLLHEPVTS